MTENYYPGADPGLLREIRAIVAVDGHAHPLTPERELDADPDDPLAKRLHDSLAASDFSLPVRLRPSNPEYIDAWTALWGYQHNDFDPSHLADLVAIKHKIRAEQGSNYAPWVLDQLGFSTMIAIGRGPEPTQPAPRFRWCAHLDWLLWPFASSSSSAPHMTDLYLGWASQERAALGLEGSPPTLDAFISELLVPSLERCVAEGAVGIKFNTPYFRSLAFTAPTDEDARILYLRGVQQGSLSYADHVIVQDYIFRVLVTHAGKLRLPVQMHTGLGIMPQYNVSGSNPLLMEPVFRDIPDTTFVLLHGAWPFDRQAISLLTYPNVYVDYSCANIYFYPRALSAIMRGALEWHPEKVLFGTDAYEDQDLAMLAGVTPHAAPLAGWEEKAWLMDRAGRSALALALSGMRSDGDLTADRATEISLDVMRGNAANLYGLAAMP